MSTIATPAPILRPTLADRFVPRRGVLTDVLLIAAGVAVTAGFAKVEVPMWPVPITGQTLAVVLVGAALGTRRATIALTAYLALGLAGVPVFADAIAGPAYVLQPSFGFIIGFAPAAALIGWLAEHRWDRKPVLSLAAFGAASIIPFLIGVPYMAIVVGAMGLPNDPETVISLGVTPFILGGVVKWLGAAALLPAIWKLVAVVDSRRDDAD